MKEKLKNLIDRYQGWFFISLLLISLILFIAPYFIYQILSWSDHWRGLGSALFHSVLYTIIWTIFFLPYYLVIYGIYRWKKWKRFLALWILTPVVFLSSASAADFVSAFPTPQERFRRFTKIELPKKIENFHYYFSGGGVIDFTDTYYFTCSRKDTRRLIKEFGFKEGESIDKSQFYCNIKIFNGCPDYREWHNGKMYQYIGDEWFYYLFTDETETHVYMLVGCI